MKRKTIQREHFHVVFPSNVFCHNDVSISDMLGLFIKR